MAFVQTKKVVDTRFIGANILQFIRDNQAEVLTIANGGTALKSFQQIVDSIANRANPMFPSLAIESEGSATEFDSDVLGSAYRVTFEAMIYGTNASALPSLAKKYAYALELMLINIPRATLLANSGLTDLAVRSIETDHDPLKTNDNHTEFFQVFQTRIIYNIWRGAQ